MRTANAGSALGQYNLGSAYCHGSGVAVDKDEGIKLITRSAEAGYDLAIAQLKLFNLWIDEATLGFGFSRLLVHYKSAPIYET